MSTKLTRFRRLCIPLVSVLAITAVATASTTNHWTTGTGGIHSAASHGTNNPGHIWAAIKADHTGSISSGGRFHDGPCSLTRCYGAFAGSDYSLDNGGGGGTAAKLYIDLGGIGGGASPAPDNNRNMSVSARVADQGNFRNDPVGRPACSWQKLDILATYYDEAGTKYGNKVIGALWMAHVTSFVYPVGTVINTNTVKANANGTGSSYYVSGVTIGTIHNGGDAGPAPVCSDGSHVHLEFVSNHNWGSEYEWHNDAGPDGYNGLAGVGAHIHGANVNAAYSFPGAESTTQGSTILAHLGGDTTLFWMRDNPYFQSH